MRWAEVVFQSPSCAPKQYDRELRSSGFELVTCESRGGRSTTGPYCFGIGEYKYKILGNLSTHRRLYYKQYTLVVAVKATKVNWSVTQNTYPGQVDLALASAGLGGRSAPWQPSVWKMPRTLYTVYHYSIILKEQARLKSMGRHQNFKVVIKLWCN